MPPLHAQVYDIVRRAYQTALDLTQNDVERAAILRQLRQMGEGG